MIFRGRFFDVKCLNDNKKKYKNLELVFSGSVTLYSV